MPYSKKEPSTAEKLFITGCYRSGTTLIEKLLHHHGSICLASQPFPILYFFVKSEFNRKIGITRRYPLDHLFLEHGYQPEDFHSFLDKFILSKNDLDTIFNQMAEYKLGLWTPEILRFRNDVVPGSFFEVYEQLNDFIAKLFPKTDLRYLGGKEVLCEEYIPYLVNRGVNSIIVIRDPRDMITSLNFRERDNLTGENRPILYSLRAWRKSVAISLAYESHPGFEWFRYEDLVENPIKILNQITTFLNIPPFSSQMFKDGIYDQYGNLWKGNSSFDDRAGISTDSIGQHQKRLPRDVTAYIETCCLPEMNALGYVIPQKDDIDPNVIYQYQDPFEVKHDKFVSDYSSLSEHEEEEIIRLNMLVDKRITPSTEDIKLWFLYEQAFKKLRSVV